MRPILSIRCLWPGVLFFMPAVLHGQILVSQPPPLARWDAAEVERVAGDIRAAGERARLLAAQEAQPGRRDQSAALASLTTLASTAQHFATLIADQKGGPAATRAGYLALLRAYHQARPDVLMAGFAAPVMESFNQVGQLLERIDMVYMQPWEAGTASASADALAGAAGGALRIAGQHSKPTPADRRALFLLGRFQQSAEYFAHQLAAQSDPQTIGEDFRLLLDDHAEAVRGLRPASFAEDIENQITQARRLMEDLRRGYQMPWSGSAARTAAEIVRNLAHEMLDVVSAQPGDGDPAELGTVNHLVLLAQVADRLARQLEVLPEVPARSYSDFLTLVATYDYAGYGPAPFAVGRLLPVNMDRIGWQIVQLDRLYSGGMAQGPARVTGTVIGR